MWKLGMTVATALVLSVGSIPAGAGSVMPAVPAIAGDTNVVPVMHKGSWHGDCHRYPDRHYIQGWGRVLHRHYGQRCRVDVLRRSEYRDHRRDDCIRIGDVSICT